jgi:hypothetical protein
VLPCVITVLVAGALCASPHGVLSAALLTGVCFAVMALRFRDFLERPAAALLNAALFGAVLALPAAIVPWRGASGFAAGALLEMALDVGLLRRCRTCRAGCRAALQPELYADVLTGPCSRCCSGCRCGCCPRAKGGAPARSEPPFQVAVVLCGYEEHETIDRSLDSVLAAAERGARHAARPRRARGAGRIEPRRPRTRERLAPRVARVLAPSAASSAHGTRPRSWSRATSWWAPTRDRAYEADWLRLLLEPFQGAGRGGEHGRDAQRRGGTERQRAVPRPAQAAVHRRELGVPARGLSSSPFDPANRPVQSPPALARGGVPLRPEAAGARPRRTRPECRSYELRPYRSCASWRATLFGTRLRTF